MYAIVEIAGQQFKVAKDQKVFVHRLEEKEGSKVTFDKVLLLDDGTVTIGAPVIENAVVTAKILGHLKGDKVIVFKKKRRKGYKVKNGHRQYLSQIQIEGISTKAPAKKAAAKSTEAPAEKVEVAKKVAAPKTVAKKVAAPKAAVKKEAAPKAAAKKVAAPKATAKKAVVKKESPKK
jgi:large subunit ribosomal protein L21